MNLKVLLIILLATLFSCNYDMQYYRDIVGFWSCSEIKGSSLKFDCSGNIYRFFDNRTYARTKAEIIANGYYKIDGNKIHYGELGDRVSSFRILEVNSDTMKWESLSGEKTTIIFAREKEFN